MKTKGFTLVELLCILLLCGILYRLANSGLNTFITQQKTLTTASELFEAFQFVRTKAIMQNEWVGICGTTNETQCTTDWSKGYIIFKGQLNHPEQPIPAQQILFVSKRNPFINILSDEHLAFVFTGEGNCLSRGTLTVGLKQSLVTRQLVIYDSGRIKLLAPTREKPV